MFTMNSVRRNDVLHLIKTVPGITKPQIMAALNLQRRACEMHLARLRRDGRAHSRAVNGSMHRTWHPGEEPEYQPVRYSSVFDYAQAVAA